jgi:lauroyl/myristoyl acyltransferase
MLFQIFRVMSQVCPYLPTRLARVFCAWAGDLAYRIAPEPRAAALSNVRHILGSEAPDSTVRATAQLAFRHLALSYYDILRGHALSNAQLSAEFADVRGWHWLADALQGGRGVITAWAHFGSYNLAGHFLASHLDTRLLVPYAHQGSPQFSRLVHSLRARGAVELVPLAGSLRHIIAALRAGQALAFPVDPDGAPGSIPVEFFGTPALFPTGAVTLGLRHDAPLVVMFAVRQVDGRTSLVVEPPICLAHSGDRVRDVHEGLRRVAALLEPHIRQNPAQWSQFRPVWRN